jgi:hypothetical protein
MGQLLVINRTIDAKRLSELIDTLLQALSPTPIAGPLII